MPQPELKKLQLERLKAIVNHCYANSAFYKKKLDAANVKPVEIGMAAGSAEANLC